MVRVVAPTPTINHTPKTPPPTLAMLPLTLAERRDATPPLTLAERLLVTLPSRVTVLVLTLAERRDATPPLTLAVLVLTLAERRDTTLARPLAKPPSMEKLRCLPVPTIAALTLARRDEMEL
ncbi:MAG: hypothetical protein MJE68_22445 [Proteobacteria bacterium]|nr:hypothetical protein [Pseudomonadota bacterium]